MLISANSVSKQGGSMLIEVLISILIFAMGILAIVGLQATSISQAHDAMLRTQATLLANELIGQIWTSADRTNVAALDVYKSPSGDAYATWKSKVQTNLPGVTASSNVPTVAIGNDGTVTVTVFWKLPSEPSGVPAHSYVALAQIGG